MQMAKTENEYEENEREFERALVTLQKDANTAQPKQMLEIVRHRMDADLCYVVQDFHREGGGVVLPARGLWPASRLRSPSRPRGWTKSAKTPPSLHSRRPGPCLGAS